MDFLDQYKIENDERLAGFDTKQKRLLAMMCLERQYKTYAQLAQGKEWNRDTAYRALLDDCWRVILEDKPAEESLWERHEAIKPENIPLSSPNDDTWELSYANIFACDIMSLLETLLDDTGYEEAFRLLILDYLVTYLNGESVNFSVDTFKDDPLILAELQRQQQDEQDMAQIACFSDAKVWYAKCKSLLSQPIE